MYGIDRLRTVGEVINTHVYHMVFYQAIDDNLRIVYAQILRQLKAIQLRDTDALQFLKQRDYELIRCSFEKMTHKLNMKNFDKSATTNLKSQGYRRYNQAFYEEILLDYNVEARVAQNYRERFLVSSEDIFLVLQMYAQNDYVNHFLSVKTDEITIDHFK